MLHTKWFKVCLVICLVISAVLVPIVGIKIARAGSCSVDNLTPGRWSPVDVGQDVGFSFRASGDITSVFLTANGAGIGSVNNFYGSVSWTPNAPGHYTIVATGHTSDGGSCSRSMDFDVNGGGGGNNNPPPAQTNNGGSNNNASVPAAIDPSNSSNDACTMQRTYPSRWSPINLGENVSFYARGTSISGNIKEIRILVNGNQIGSGGGDSVSINWTPSQPGSYAISAQGRTGDDWNHYCQDVIGFVVVGNGNQVAPVGPSIPQGNPPSNPPSNGGNQGGNGSDGSGGGNPPASQPKPNYPQAQGLGTAFGQYYIYVPSGISLNLRRAPDASQDNIMGIMRSNDYFSIVSVSGSWVQVNTSLGVGWVAAQYVQITDKRTGGSGAANNLDKPTNVSAILRDLANGTPMDEPSAQLTQETIAYILQHGTYITSPEAAQIAYDVTEVIQDCGLPTIKVIGHISDAFRGDPPPIGQIASVISTAVQLSATESDTMQQCVNNHVVGPMIEKVLNSH